MTETFYDVLGVSEDASQEDVTAAYREKVKEYHPDVSDRDDAVERFKEVTRAEEVLGDEAERARYDRLGHDAYVRHLDGANAATNEGSPWTSTDRNAGDGDDSTGSRSTREHARTAAGGDDSDEGQSHHHKQRRRRQRRRRSQSTQTGTAGGQRTTAGGTAGATATGGTATGARAGTSTRSGATADQGENPDGSTYNVHDWEPAERTFIGNRPALSKNAFLQTVVLAALYPVLLYSSVSPAFPLSINLVVSALTLLLTGYLITLPTIAIPVFGLWSVFLPLVMTSVGFPALSLPVMVAALGSWIPLVYSVTVAVVLRW
jgi:curved DNA-binding protein CbpA